MTETSTLGPAVEWATDHKHPMYVTCGLGLLPRPRCARGCWCQASAGSQGGSSHLDRQVTEQQRLGLRKRNIVPVLYEKFGRVGPRWPEGSREGLTARAGMTGTSGTLDGILLDLSGANQYLTSHT